MTMMYYGDLLAASEKDITSRNFCCLVDAAVMLYEEEESDKRIFHLFPRKTRTSVKRFVPRRNTQQNPNRPSSSSSLLALNPNGPSSSSPSLLDLNTIPSDSETTEENPRNPNSNSQSSLSSCLTDNKTRKRRAVQESKRAGKTKKAKVDTFSWKGRETPEWLTLLMKDTNETVVKWGERTDLRLIFERTLFKTDVNPGESRLSMPFNELIRKDFLTPVESRIIEEDINNDKKMGVGAILVDQRNVKWGVMLKRWEMKRDSGKGSWNYNLTCGWNDIVKANGLKQGDDISIWSFRWGGLLCFALVTPLPSMAQSSSSFALCR